MYMYTLFGKSFLDCFRQNYMPVSKMSNFWDVPIPKMVFRDAVFTCLLSSATIEKRIKRQ
jgi:hypothetical protein